MTFFDFPAQHRQSIRTSNPIESAFATIRHRTRRSKGCLSRDGMLYMMFRLGQCAGQSRRKLRGFAHLADVIEGVDFINGIKPKPGRRMKVAQTPDLTVALFKPQFHTLMEKPLIALQGRHIISTSVTDFRGNPAQTSHRIRCYGRPSGKSKSGRTSHRGWIHFSGATPGFRAKARLASGSPGIFVD